MSTGADRRRRVEHAPAHAAHDLILEQHRELRRLLALGLVQTYALARGRQCAPTVLWALVSQIRTAFAAHVHDEEAALLPLFDDQRLGGSQRAQTLREEHERQRQEMDRLDAQVLASRAATFADQFDHLARTLLADIAQEERELAVAVAILDDRAALDWGITPIPGGSTTGATAGLPVR